MELIEREALARTYMSKGKNKLRLATVINELELQPTIDAAPVAHGRWVKHDGYTECSKCEYWYDSPESEDAGDRSNYCPNCGARMDGGEGHEAG